LLLHNLKINLQVFTSRIFHSLNRGKTLTGEGVDLGEKKMERGKERRQRADMGETKNPHMRLPLASKKLPEGNWKKV